MWGPRPAPIRPATARGSWIAAARPAAPSSNRACPTCPEWLDTDAKRAWCEIALRLEAMGKAVNRDALTRYAVTWRKWRKLQLYVKQHGVMVQTDEIHRLRPEAKQIASVGEQLTVLEHAFGLTPETRPRTHV